MLTAELCRTSNISYSLLPSIRVLRVVDGNAYRTGTEGSYPSIRQRILSLPVALLEDSVEILVSLGYQGLQVIVIFGMSQVCL